MTATQTPTLTDRINTTAADELEAIREEIAAELTVRWIPGYEGDPDVIGGSRTVHEPTLTPTRVVLTIDEDAECLFRKIEGETNGARWIANLDHFDEKNGRYVDYDVELTA